GHGALYDPVRRRMIVFAGFSPNVGLRDTWSLSLSGPLKWTEITPAGTLPPMGHVYSLFYDAPADRMVAWDDDQLWIVPLYGTYTWTHLMTFPTPPVGTSAAIVDPVPG